MTTLLSVFNRNLESNMKNSDDDKKKKPDKKNNSDNKNNTSADSSNQGTVSGQKPTTLEYFQYFVRKATLGVNDNDILHNRKIYYEGFKDSLRDDNQKRIYRDYSEPLIQKISDLKTERTKLKKDLETWQNDNSKYTSNFTYKNRGNHEVEINRQIDEISEQIDSLHNLLLLMQAIFYHEDIDEVELTNVKLNKIKESLERFISDDWLMNNILKQCKEKVYDDICYKNLRSNLMTSISALKDGARGSAEKIQKEQVNFNKRIDEAIKRLADDLGDIESIRSIFPMLKGRLEEVEEKQKVFKQTDKSFRIISPEKNKLFEDNGRRGTVRFEDVSSVSSAEPDFGFDDQSSDEVSFTDGGQKLKSLKDIIVKFEEIVKQLEEKLRYLRDLKGTFGDFGKSNGMNISLISYRNNTGIASFKSAIDEKFSPILTELVSLEGSTRTYKADEPEKYTPVITTDALGFDYLPLPWVWLCAINQLPIGILRYILTELPNLDVNHRSGTGEHPIKQLILDGAFDKAALLIPYALEFSPEDIYGRASEQIKFLEDLSSATDTKGTKKIGEYLFDNSTIRDTVFIHFNHNIFWIDIYAQSTYKAIAEAFFNYRYTPDSLFNPDLELAHIPFWGKIILGNYEGLTESQCQYIIKRYCNGNALGLIQEIAAAARQSDLQSYTDEISAVQDPRLINMVVNLSGLITIPDNVKTNGSQDLLKYFDTMTLESDIRFLNDDVERIFDSPESSVSYVMKNAKKLRCNQSTLTIQQKIVSYGEAPKEVAKKSEENLKKEEADKKSTNDKDKGGGLKESIDNFVYHAGVIVITAASLGAIVYLMSTWLSNRYGRALSKEREKEMEKMIKDMGERYTFEPDDVYKKINPKSLNDPFAKLYEEEEGEDDDQDDDDNPLKEHKLKSSINAISEKDTKREEIVLSPKIDNPEEKVEAPSLMLVKRMVQAQKEGGELSNSIKEPDVMIFPDIIILPGKTAVPGKEVETSHPMFAVSYGSDVGMGVGVHKIWMEGKYEKLHNSEEEYNGFSNVDYENPANLL